MNHISLHPTAVHLGNNIISSVITQIELYSFSIHCRASMRRASSKKEQQIAFQEAAVFQGDKTYLKADIPYLKTYPVS